MTDQFYWYDLETFGKNARTSRIAQFAGQRTDADLNPIDAPLSIFCKAAPDFLPEPEAVLITGISPQLTQAYGYCEADFFAQVHEQLKKANTCTTGYNSLRFDDEFIRFGLYRNFFDPYEREYANGNSRWDLMDVMRMCYALRPEGIAWPTRPDGSISFKLEDLANANHCLEGNAHEALSDVRSLINLARLVKERQPKTWHYCLGLRNKNYISQLLDPTKRSPLLHVSGQFPTQHYCSALVLPLLTHPIIGNRTIAIALNSQALELLDYSVAEIEANLFTKQIDLPEGEQRIGVKEIHHNKCPILVQPSHLQDKDKERLQIDLDAADDIAKQLTADPSVADKLAKVYSKKREFDDEDPDGALYAGFIENKDKQLFSVARASRGRAEIQFKDNRLNGLYFRYKARNWPETLNDSEMIRWQQLRRQRILPSTLDWYQQQLALLKSTHTDDSQLSLITELEHWAAQIADESIFI